MILSTVTMLLLGLSMSSDAQPTPQVDPDRGHWADVALLRPASPTSLAVGDPLGHEMLFCQQNTFQRTTRVAAAWTVMPGEPVTHVAWTD